MQGNRLLVINPFGIGDVLFSTPLVSALRAAFPGGYIAYLSNRRTAETLLTNPVINEVLVFERDEYRALWKRSKAECLKKLYEFYQVLKSKHFDIAIDMSLGHQYSLALMLAGVKKRIGFDYRGRGRFQTEKVAITGYDQKHMVEYYLDLLRPLGIRPADNTFKIYVTEQERKEAEGFWRARVGSGEAIAVFPGGGASWGRESYRKHWPAANFMELGRMLARKHGCAVLVMGSEAENTLCREVTAGIGTGAVNASGMPLRVSCALLTMCRLVICNDGGPLHMAVAMGTKTVSIFGAVPEKVYGPYPPGPSHVVVKSAIPCRPCYHNFKMPPCTYNLECLKKITVSQVLEAVEGLYG